MQAIVDFSSSQLQETQLDSHLSCPICLPSNNMQVQSISLAIFLASTGTMAFLDRATLAESYQAMQNPALASNLTAATNFAIHDARNAISVEAVGLEPMMFQEKDQGQKTLAKRRHHHHSKKISASPRFRSSSPWALFLLTLIIAFVTTGAAASS